MAFEVSIPPAPAVTQIPLPVRSRIRSARIGETLRWRVEENLRESYRLMARCACDGAILETGGACFVASGVPSAFFNPVFLDYQRDAPDDLAQFLTRARAFYDARGGLPWSLVTTVYDDAEDVLPTDRLRDAGLSPVGKIPLLVRFLDRWNTTARPPTSRRRDDGTPRPRISQTGDLYVEQIRDGDGLYDHRTTLINAFGLPPYVADVLFGEMPPPILRLYVAHKNGEPVGTVSLLEAGGVAGIYNLATHSAHRRIGVARALLRHVTHEALWETRADVLVTQASRPAIGLFAQAGWERVADALRFVEPCHFPGSDQRKPQDPCPL